jgi:DNA-binding winged helix-turn-helix (wHTH) protein
MAAGAGYRFGQFVLNLDRSCLQKGGADLALRPKAFDVLRYLVERAGRLATKDELVAAVWPNVIVSDDSVAQCIHDIRKVLNDDGGLFIKTVQRRGYMFVAETVPLAAADTPAPPRAAADGAAGRGRRLAASLRGRIAPLGALPALAALVVAAAVAAWVLAWFARQPSAPNLRALASGNHPFDGLWRVVDRGNQYCFIQRGIMLWTIAEGRVGHDGDGDGIVSAAGELSFKRASKLNPSLLVVFSARLDGHRGSGTYYVEQGRCAGAIEMTRLGQGVGPVR